MQNTSTHSSPKYRLTLIGLVIAILLYGTTVLLNMELFEKIVVLMSHLEKYEIDEMIIPLVVFLLFLFWDFYKRSKKIEIEHAKLSIYKAMLSSSHHILNSLIYQMDIFKLTAEDTPGFDAQILSYYEEIISNTSEQIDSLSNLSEIDENSIRSSVLA